MPPSRSQLPEGTRRLQTSGQPPPPPGAPTRSADVASQRQWREPADRSLVPTQSPTPCRSWKLRNATAVDSISQGDAWNRLVLSNGPPHP